MNWPRLISVAAHGALIGWIYHLSTLPAAPLVLERPLFADIVEPLPIPPAPPTPADAPIEPTDTFIRDPQPVFRPHPEYPERALRFKREGVVELEFTIATDGSVRDIRVILSDPEGVFDRAATKALAKWRYAPQLVNSVPSERTGVRVRIVFKLDRT